LFSFFFSLYPALFLAPGYELLPVAYDEKYCTFLQAILDGLEVLEAVVHAEQADLMPAVFAR